MPDPESQVEEFDGMIVGPQARDRAVADSCGPGDCPQRPSRTCRQRANAPSNNCARAPWTSLVATDAGGQGPGCGPHQPCRELRHPTDTQAYVHRVVAPVAPVDPAGDLVTRERYLLKVIEKATSTAGADGPASAGDINDSRLARFDASIAQALRSPEVGFFREVVGHYVRGRCPGGGCRCRLWRWSARRQSAAARSGRRSRVTTTAGQAADEIRAMTPVPDRRRPPGSRGSTPDHGALAKRRWPAAPRTSVASTSARITRWNSPADLTAETKERLKAHSHFGSADPPHDRPQARTAEAVTAADRPDRPRLRDDRGSKAQTAQSLEISLEPR